MALMDTHQTDVHTLSLQNPNDSADASTHSETSSSSNSPQKKLPQRSCIVTREPHDKADLLRFVRAKDGALYFDLNHKLPGRGLYVSPTRTHLQTAMDKNLFSKAAKNKVTIPSDLMTQIETNLRRSALDHINLARRSSDIITSAEKIKKYIKNSRLGCYITSSSKESDSYKSIVPNLKSAPIITLFSAEELNTALKMEKVAHVAFKSTPLCQKFLKLIQILNNLKETKE